MIDVGKIPFRIVYKFLLWFLLLSLSPLIIVFCFYHYYSFNSAKKQAVGKLISIARHKTEEIENYLNERKKDISILAEIPLITSEIDHLQHNFRAHGINSPEYQSSEEKILPIFSKFQKKGYYDLFLISPDGEIFFSVKKEVDLGSNLQTCSYRDSAFANAFKQIIAGAEIYLSAYKFYPPSGESAAFIILLIGLLSCLPPRSCKTENSRELLPCKWITEKSSSISTIIQDWAKPGK